MLDIQDDMPYVQAAWEHMYYAAQRCRSDANKLIIRAEIYEDCASKLEMTMEKEMGERIKECQPQSK